MNESKHCVLCVDDEEGILSSLKRLLRKEEYRLMTASSASNGLKVLEENQVQLVISDQRMPGMSGTEFLSIVNEKSPDTIRVVLSGYTDVDSITESINQGHIYKFLLKPWNDQNLKLEIRQALEQYDLIQANRSLDKKIMEQNEELKRINENLEVIVAERTKEVQIQNHVLELSRAMLDDLPVPLVGVSADGMIATINKEGKGLSCDGRRIGIAGEISDYFSTQIQECIAGALESGEAGRVKGYRLGEKLYNVVITPLSDHFAGKGVVMTFWQDG